LSLCLCEISHHQYTVGQYVPTTPPNFIKLSHKGNEIVVFLTHFNCVISEPSVCAKTHRRPATTTTNDRSAKPSRTVRRSTHRSVGSISEKKSPNHIFRRSLGLHLGLWIAPTCGYPHTEVQPNSTSENVFRTFFLSIPRKNRDFDHLKFPKYKLRGSVGLHLGVWVPPTCARVPTKVQRKGSPENVFRRFSLRILSRKKIEISTLKNFSPLGKIS